MVGVKPLEPPHKQAVERSTGSSGGGAPASLYTAPFPKPSAVRAYAIEGGGASAAAVVPLQNKTAWSKVTEFVFGL